MQIKNLNMSFGTQVIFNNVSLSIPYNEKIGVVGVNGAGKTTLFRIIMGLENADSGKILLKNNYRVDWLPQVISDNIDNMEMSVFDYLISARPINELSSRLQELYDKLADPNCNQKVVFNEIDKIQKKLEYWDYYNADVVLLKIIDGVGIEDDVLGKKLSELSGGQKSKVAFVRLLYSHPEVILLDEPTNHLDEKSKQYIINYLKSYKGTVFIISHDIDKNNCEYTKKLFKKIHHI